nr:MAG TPA: hypothetical protein [Caudoviricetes sp.]
MRTPPKICLPRLLDFNHVIIFFIAIMILCSWQI